MTRRIIIFIFLLTVISIPGQGCDSLSNNILWKEAEQYIEAKEYEKATHLYEVLNKEVDSIYKEISSRQVDDLRSTYSIDELALESNIERNNLLYLLVSGLIILIIILLIIFIILRIQKGRLRCRQAQLIQAKDTFDASIQSKSLFLSNMSHEIRTPLNALSGFSSLLSEEGLDQSARQQCNDIIQQNSKLLLNLINDVVDTSFVDTNKMNFIIKNCEVVNLCQNVVNTLEGIKQTDANLLFRCSEPTLTIETDTLRLQQVLINIMVNATKFTKKGSIILLLEKDGEKQLKFTITDTGCGIPKDKQNKIFNRFEKLNEKAQGTGIGLSICQEIISNLGGKIWIDKSYNDGARFIFTHPLKQNPSL